MLKLYDYLPSGNGYKVRLLLSQLGIRFGLVEKDILKGETRTSEFLAINPNGRIPVMEQRLATRRFFVGERYTIADVALYAYTHVAHEGGFDLAAYPNVRAWLARIAAEPGHVTITHRQSA